MSAIRHGHLLLSIIKSSSYCWAGVYNCTLVQYLCACADYLSCAFGHGHALGSSRFLSLDKTRYFGECGGGGHLILIQSHSHSAVRFKICEMDKDCCFWNVKFCVDLKTFISRIPKIQSKKRYKFTVMCAVEGEKENDFALRDDLKNVPSCASVSPLVESLTFI